MTFQRLKGWLTRQRATAIGLLVLFCAAPFPLPLDPPSQHQADVNSSKDLSAPFPCQHRQCGCRSADQCWKKCCCFTNAQKLSWARSQRVSPPRYVILAAEREKLVDQHMAGTSPVCCTKQPAVPAQTSRLVDVATRANSCEPAAGQNVVLVVQALECQGSGGYWLEFVLLTLPDSVVAVQRTEPSDEVRLIPAAQYIHNATEPPTPPPRLVAPAVGPLRIADC